jgi:signal peptidase I
MSVTAVAARPQPSRASGRQGGRAGRVRTVLGWLLLVLALLAWAVTLRPADLGGPATYVVVSGDSMEPVLSDGDFVVLREQAEYAVDDIVAFPVPEGRIGAGTLVIHRIVGAEGGAFVPQGDNRDQVDEWRPTTDEVLGSLWVHVPRGGKILMTALQPPVVAAVAGGLMTMWVLTREPTRKDDGEDDSDDEDA